MSWIPARDRSARRLAVVDGYRFPAGVRHRFTLRHGDLDTLGITLVEDATRQWFRLAARHPKARLAMPSVAVDGLWRELLLDTRDYTSLCEAAFGRILSSEPESGARLAETFRLAREDEGCPPEALPLLFRVDHEVGLEGGRVYLADCGGRGQCHELPGAICLRHIAGVERTRRRWRNFHADPMPHGYEPDSGIGDFGGGCGFGP